MAFYGYAAFLVIPLRTAAEAVDKITRAFVGARRMLDMLAVERLVHDPEEPAAEPPPGALLADGAHRRSSSSRGSSPRSSRASRRTAAELADRLGRFVDDPGVTLGGVRLVDLPVEVVRRRVVVSETDPMLFSGSLRRELDPGGAADDERVLAAVGVANAEDVLEALPEGLDAQVEERGRGFSGGQRQRLVLARALLSDAEMLVLVEPTSAVDAHTEARVARRLREARAGRTTVVSRRARSCSTRPTASSSSPGAGRSRRGPTASCCARAPPTARP